jgi:hypothetical protein
VLDYRVDKTAIAKNSARPNDLASALASGNRRGNRFRVILYVNGVAAETNATAITLPRGRIGGLLNTGDHLHGVLDETTLFNRALSLAEIQQVINATRGP